MEAKDLRLGNYFQSNHFKMHNELLIIKAIFKNKATVYSSKLNIEFNVSINPELKPIPLSKEWILKLGFEQYFEDDSVAPSYHLGNFIVNEKFQPVDCGFEISEIEVKHVHQLQNLFFALKGKELTLNKKYDT